MNSQLSTQATDKESTSSKENLITTPKKNKLASANLAHENKRKEQGITQNSAVKAAQQRIRGKKADQEEEKEENPTSHGILHYSKMENNYHLSNKKAIYYNMKVYYEALNREYWKTLPLQFHIKEGVNDP